MIILTTNHKVGDDVYVVDNCVRRGIVQTVNFAQLDDSDNRFTLSYDILYDGFSFNTTVDSSVDYGVSAGSPRVVGSPPRHGSPLGSPSSGGVGSPRQFVVAVEEVDNGGGIYINKNAALTAFGDTLA